MTSLKKDPSGRRTIELEVEVPGTPEQVWQAIATGPGISSWFVDTDLDGRVGGTVVTHMGPGMDSTATITAWEPLRRFAKEGSELMPGAPSLATEWSISTRGGKCVVRVVHSLFASSDDWDDQLTSLESGWPTYFEVLRLYLAHFAGQPVASVQAMAMASGTDAAAWDVLASGLGLLGAGIGQHRESAPGAPAFSGIVERVGGGQHPHQLTLRLEQPAPAIALFGAFDCGGMVLANVCVHFFGERAAAVCAREQPTWQAWLAERFPAPSAASNAA